ncbi:nucleotidyltransferase domain-containing protein [Streptomyces tubbatahanensis]|uniref:Nucleotidyltransferase domain-containing protein n=1 Tax=Streptomyces tubbatahanensis TaxID=2923272 RepID=A0ABY3Y0H6_9ACTN|nr:nucleotidyltransferase domain-containing protein [Streptomyces tubbatahanensis]UNT00079.1 nucleotidyltransferase domain-containing protein [Streptomyces tubbatahanensis]
MRHPPLPSPGPGLPAARVTEINEVLARVTEWAARRPDVAGLLLVGSCARGTARTSSDIDLVLLVADVSAFDGDAWAHGLGLPQPVRTRQWGAIRERRFAARSGLEVEFGIGAPSWAATQPVDPGTRRVVGDGALVLHDPVGLLAELKDACRGG